MSMTHNDAVEALKALLWELPYEFSVDPEITPTRSQFKVIKASNVRKIHKALWELQVYFGMVE